MRLLHRLRRLFTRAAKAVGINLPTRSGDLTTSISVDSAVGLVAVYRAIFVITTAASQLSLDVERSGIKLTGAQVPSYIRRPSLRMSRSDFIEALVMSLATTGNAYLRKITGPEGQILDLDPLNPHECLATIDPKTGIKTVWYRGVEYQANEIQHLAFMTLPGSPSGLGPIQAAQVDLSAAKQIRDYAARWFTETGQPAGILSTEQKDVTPEHLKAMRNAWNYMDPDGTPQDPSENPSRVRVLSGGMTYSPIFISPKDAQWIEARQYTTLEAARLFGIPAPLMLAAVEGNAQTYSNVEQEWIAFTRFTLTAYLRKIEEALSALAPNGQTVRFNIESLLRSDTKSRYEAHQIAITMGLYSAEYARQVEGIPSTAAPKEPNNVNV